MELGGRLLPAGASIVPSIHLVHRRPDIYPEPDEFRPERFIESRGRPPAGDLHVDPVRRRHPPLPRRGVRAVRDGGRAAELVLRRTLAPSRPESERNYRRAITETPRHDAEVVGCSATEP